MKSRGAAWLVMLGVAATLMLAAPAHAKPRVKVGSIVGPLSNPIMWNILKARGFDGANGFEIEIKLYPSIAAFYAGFTGGEVDVIMGGPTNFAKLHSDRVPLRIFATGLKLSDLVIFTRDPAVKTLTDLRGKLLAIDQGGSQYQIVDIYARAKKFDLRKEVQLVNANFVVSRAQLLAGRVQAAMIAEPLATLTMRSNPELRIIFNGNDGWRELTGHDGFETVTAAREEFLKASPQTVPQLIKAMQDTVTYIRAHPDEADKIVAETTQLAPGAFKEAVEKRRLDYDIQPAWGDRRAVIWDLFERAVAAGFYPKVPDETIIYKP